MPKKPLDVKTPVPPHQQDQVGYCGSACVQMVLDAMQGLLLEQDDLLQQVPPVPGWSTSPDDLVETLNLNLPAPLFAELVSPYRVTAMRRVAWSMCHHRLPAVALVDDGSHWIVIEGLIGTFDTGDKRHQPDITEVQVSDPYPPVELLRERGIPVGPPHVHQDPDACSDVHIEEEFYAWGDWEGKFTRCGLDGDWSNKWVVVYVPWDTPPKVSELKWPAAAAGEGGSGESIPHAIEAMLADALASERLGRLAVEGLRRSGFAKREQWMRALGRATTCTTQLVRRLDGKRSYYLVALTGPEDGGRLLLRLDARSGRLLHGALNPSPMLLERLEETRVDRHPLVWRPCNESRSPFYPFVQATEGGRRVYRLLNRKAFPSLTRRPLRIAGPRR
jgi:hypothetical protein